MSPNRRQLLRLLAGAATTALGASGVPGTTGVAASVTPSGPPPGPPLDGELLVDETARAAAADDFGHLVHRMPTAVLLPGSTRDVAAVIRWAGRQGVTVAPQGHRHSVYGRAQAPGGIVIDMSALRMVHRVDADRVVVDAGATWSDVLAATLPHGLTPPVLTDYLGLSVAGTLVVGGVGATTARHGVQSDNVLELVVVTGRGDRFTCSRHLHRELFDAVRAGLGQVGVVTQATLRLVPAPPQVRRFLLSYADLAGLLHDAVGSTPMVASGRSKAPALPTPNGWRYRLDLVAPLAGDAPVDDDALLAGLSDDRGTAEISTVPYLDYVNRLAALEGLLRSNGQWSHPHPWLTTFVADANAESVVGTELAFLSPADLGPFGQVVLSPLRRDAVTSPLLRLPADERCFAFNLIRIPTTADRAEADRLVAQNRVIYDRVAAAGGVLYPVSAVPMSGGDWRRHFGPAWERLRRAKATFDPDHVLTPGYEVFAA